MIKAIPSPMKPNAKQIIVFVVAILAVGFAVYWGTRGDGEVKLKHRVLLVDVTTGELFEADTSERPVILPGTHPDRKENVLLRATKDDATGEWFVRERDRPYVGDLGVDPKAIEPETGKVLTPSDKVRRYVPGKQ
ncbi:MAG: hypothetical protein KF745_11210 [Phycisphaeraceae bacterium]|nr:hypothetical protein [Phycisphaeraceae bacterium]